MILIWSISSFLYESCSVWRHRHLFCDIFLDILQNFFAETSSEQLLTILINPTLQIYWHTSDCYFTRWTYEGVKHKTHFLISSRKHSTYKLNHIVRHRMRKNTIWSEHTGGDWKPHESTFLSKKGFQQRFLFKKNSVKLSILSKYWSRIKALGLLMSLW